MATKLQTQFTRTHVLLLLICLLLAGIVTLSMTGSHAAQKLVNKVQMQTGTNFFDLPSAGRDGDGQRTIG